MTSYNFEASMEVGDERIVFIVHDVVRAPGLTPSDPPTPHKLLMAHNDRVIQTKMKLGDYCLGCPHTLICVSFPVVVESCSGCKRKYLNGFEIPSKIDCQGANQGRKDSSMHYRQVCRTCAQEIINEYFVSEINQYVGEAFSPGIVSRITNHAEGIATRIRKETGQRVTIDVRNNTY